MATQQTAFTSTCLMCLESKTLKIIGKCKHSFCVECLTTLLGRLGREKETFPCPSCKVKCQVPPNGPKGLMDFNGAVEDLTKAAAEAEDTVDEICDLCNYKQQKVTAANICDECDRINICHDCSKLHRANKATQNHILTPIVGKQRENELTCGSHGKPLTSFCATCAQPVCKICVSLLHGDHDVERLADVVRSKVEEVKVTLEVQKGKLKSLKQVERELNVLKTTLTSLTILDEEKNILIKGIEDHAQMVIDQVVKWKLDSKKEVEDDYKVMKDIPVCFQKVSVAVQELEQTINKVSQLLSDSELHPVYLDKLTTLQKELGAIDGGKDAPDTGELRDRLVDLRKNRRVLVSEEVPRNHGHIEKKDRSWNFFHAIPYFQHTMKVDSNTMTIPCVTCLSTKHFAVAHPVKLGQLSNAIDIYELTGTFKHTLKDQVPLFYDMSSTPDGLLALVSDGESGGSCSVKLFHPESGYVSSTQDFTIAKPMSLGVTIQHQYVILGGNQEGVLQITVVDEAGCVEHEHILDGTSKPEKITCGWKFIFTGGRDGITVYELKDTGLLRIKHFRDDFISLMADISATALDDVVITWTANNDKQYLEEYTERHQEWSWFCGGYIQKVGCEGGGYEARVSTRDGNIVVWSSGQTIQVSKST